MRKSRILSLVLMLALVLTPVVSLARVGRSYAQDCDLFTGGNPEGTNGNNTINCGNTPNGATNAIDGDDIINVPVGVTVTMLDTANLSGDGYSSGVAGTGTTPLTSGNDTININGTVVCSPAGTANEGLVGDNVFAGTVPPAVSGNDTININAGGIVTACDIFGDNRTDMGGTYTNAGVTDGNDNFNLNGTYTGGTVFGQGGVDTFTVNSTADVTGSLLGGDGNDIFNLNMGVYNAGDWSGAAAVSGTLNGENGTDAFTLTFSTDDQSVIDSINASCASAASCTVTINGQTFQVLNFETVNKNLTFTGATPVPPGVTPTVTPVGGTTGGGSTGGGDTGGGGTFTVTFVLVPVAPAKVGNAFVGGGILALGNIRIRQTPDLGGVVLGQIPWGTIVTVLKDNPSKEWVFIRYGAVEGWVSANWFVLPNGDTLYSPEELGLGFIIPANGARAVGNVRMRSQPNLGAEVVGQVPWGRIVTILDEDPSGLWWLISFRGKQAWVSNEWFEIPDGSIYTPYGGFFTPGDIPVEEYVLDLSDVHAASGTAVALAPVRLRFAPTLAAPRMGLVDWGDVVVIRGVDSTGNWWLVDYDGTSGWVANEWFVRQ